MFTGVEAGTHTLRPVVAPRADRPPTFPALPEVPVSRIRTTLALAATVSLSACAVAQAKPATITMSGSTSVAPLATNLAKAYVKAFPGKAKFKLLQGGSDIGVNDVSRGRVTVGNVSRDPLPSDPGGLVFNRIARDGVCIVTNTSNAIANISKAQVQAIFSGRIRRWDDVPGAKITGAIDLISRTAASGTADAFQNIFMGPDLRIASSASTKTSNGLVQQSVSSNRNAIGFVSFDFVKGVHAAPYEGVTCTLRNAKSGQYKGVRNFWMVTRGKATGATRTWIRWIQNASAAQKVISKGWISLR